MLGEGYNHKGQSLRELVLPCRFLVLFGNVPFSFQSVSGIGKQRDYQYINEGGRNDYPIRLINPQSSIYQLTFKRGIPVDAGEDSCFLSDYFCYMQGASGPNKQLTKNIRGSAGTIIVLGEEQEPRLRYDFMIQGISEWSVDDLDAMNGSSPLIESVTVIHNGLTRTPLDWKSK